MRFSWKGALLAPLVVTAILSVVMALLTAQPGWGWVLGGFIYLIPGLVIGYLTMFCLFLPCLWVLSHATRLHWWAVYAVGAVLGALWFPPLVWLMWSSSGADSGPPSETFIAFVLRWGAQGDLFEFLVLPLAGFATAATYWQLGRKRVSGRTVDAGPQD